MDYNDEFTEDTFPRRTDDRYKRIENFKPYELTHCIVFEMAGRNKEVRASIQLLASIEEVLKIRYKKIPNNKETIDIDELLGIDDAVEVSKEKYAQLEKQRRKFKETFDEGIHILRNKYYIHYNQNTVNIPEIENPFKEKDFTGMSIEEIEEEFSIALNSPMMKHISGGIGKFLHGEEYPDYKSDHNIFEGFVTARGIESRCKTFNISSINTHFQRKIYDTNQINVALNMALPEKELVEYVKHIHKTLSNTNSNKLKSPHNLLGAEVKEVTKTKNYPKKPTALKMADYFFVYDYVTAKLKQIEEDQILIDKDFKYNEKQIKKNRSLTNREKKIQIDELKKEYNENKVITKIDDIFKELESSTQDTVFKSSTVSNYYYALKPYIEECRYTEFLTGESIIEDEKDLVK